MHTRHAESRLSYSTPARRATAVLLVLSLALLLAGPFIPARMKTAQA